MYFAEMYKWGNSNDKIGVTGIIGCMGIVYIGHNGMYAIHIPDNGRAFDEQATDLFIGHVTNNEVSFGSKYARIYTFANGINRNNSDAGSCSAEEISNRAKRGLGSPPTKLYRIMKGLGAGSGGLMAKSVAIMISRNHSNKQNDTGCELFFKPNDDITWVSHIKKSAGAYKGREIGTDSPVPDNLVAGWTRMSDKNCKIIKS